MAGHQVSDGALMQNGKRVEQDQVERNRRLRLKCDEDLEAEGKEGGAWERTELRRLGAWLAELLRSEGGLGVGASVAKYLSQSSAGTHAGVASYRPDSLRTRER